MGELRIMDYNYAFAPEVGLSGSSEDSEYPASNLANHLRSKAWRSAGYFAITTSNRKINFKESSGGSELTATLTVDTYTPTELAAEIKLALEDAGAETYTVTFSTLTGKWTIAHAGSYLSILWASGTDTANTLAGTIGFDATTDSTDAVTYTGAFIALHTEERVTADLRTWETNPIDSVALVWDPTEGPRLSEQAVVTLQASQTLNWASPAVSQVLTVDSTYGCATHFFSSSQAYRYWSIKIVDPKNPYLAVQIGKLVLSKATQLTQPPGIGFTARVDDQSSSERNEYGHIYSDIYPTLRSLDFNFSALSSADIETLYTIYERVGKTVPIAVALDATATLWDKDRFFIYGRMKGDLSTPQRFHQYFDANLSVVEAL